MLKLIPAELPQALLGRPEACAYAARTNHALSDGDLEQALEHSRASVQAFRRAGVVRDLVDTLLSTAHILWELGAYDDAKPYLTEALQHGERLGVRRWISEAQLDLGRTSLRRAQNEEAQRALSESVEGYVRLGMMRDVGLARAYLALSAAQRGDIVRAAEFAAKSLDDAACEPGAHALALATAAKVALLRHQPMEARGLAENALQLVREHHLYEHVAFARLTHVESLVSCGLLQEASSALADAHVWLHERAAMIEDEGLRHSFLNQVPENARILMLGAQELGK